MITSRVRALLGEQVTGARQLWRRHSGLYYAHLQQPPKIRESVIACSATSVTSDAKSIGAIACRIRESEGNVFDVQLEVRAEFRFAPQYWPARPGLVSLRNP